MNTAKQVISVRDLPIHIVKKRVKNLHLSVEPPEGQIRVAAPIGMKDDAIRLAVISRLSWIKKQQTKYLTQKRQSKREYLSGENHYLLGKSYRLLLEVAEGKPRVFIKGKSQIVMQVPKKFSVEKKGELLKKWYRSHFNDVLSSLIPKWEKQMKLKPAKVGIRQMKVRWGSCNQSKKTILLNLELIKKPILCIEYVLMHEFCHLIEKKHNDVFLAMMDKQMPKWRMYKEELNKLPLSHEKWNY